jgi:hypothetical protein
LAAQPEHETISVRRIVFSPFAEGLGGSIQRRTGRVPLSIIDTDLRHGFFVFFVSLW